MKYITGIKLRNQPRNLQYGFRFDTDKINYDEDENGVRSYKKYYSIAKWCDETFKCHQATSFSNYWSWWASSGTKYYYYFFKTKEDAMLFKMIWG